MGKRRGRDEERGKRREGGKKWQEEDNYYPVQVEKAKEELDRAVKAATAEKERWRVCHCTNTLQVLKLANFTNLEAFMKLFQQNF